MLDIQNTLFTYADPEYAAFHQKICPNAGQMIGVRLPFLQKIAKEIAKEKDWQNFLQMEPVYYEEIMLQGLLLGNISCSLEERLHWIADFVPKIKNWAICDSVCGNLKIARKHPEVFWLFLLPYLSSTEEFQVRFGVVMLLDHFIRNEVWRQKAVEEIMQITHAGYYVKMAVAWTLAEAFLQDPETMKSNFQNHFLDGETKKMMIRKLLDSRRLSLKEKQMLRNELA